MAKAGGLGDVVGALPKYQNKSEFARLIQVSPEYLYHILAGRRMIADILARRIEKDLKKSKGWLDIQI